MELKKILISIAAMFILLMALNVIGDKFFSGLYLRNYSGQSGGKINYYLNQKPEAEILIMGNSRALYQIIPDSFANANTYNLCHAGMDDCFQLGLLHYIIGCGKKPVTIFLQIDPEFYSKTDEKIAFVSKDIQQLKYYYFKDSLIRFHINQMDKYEQYKNLLPLYKYNGKVISLLKNVFASSKAKFDKNKGFILVKPTKMDSINTITAYKVNAPRTVFVFDKERIKYLVDIISICKLNQIQLICFTSPHYKYNKSIYVNLKYQLDSLLAEQNIRYVDFDENLILRNELKEASFWKDHMHLNLRGAALESSYLGAIADSLLNKKQ